MYSAPSHQLFTGALTVSYQYVGKCVVFPAPPIDLYRPHERHYDHNEIENHGAAPGRCQTLDSAISPKNRWPITGKYPRQALITENEELRVPKDLN